MKRLNPETKEPFKKGDVRKDGRLFWGYCKDRIKLNGFFVESWLTKKSFEHKQGLKAKYHVSPLGRATMLILDAKRRHPLSITREWVAEKLEKGVCELSGLKFDMYPTKKSYHNPYAPSLDRINCKKGYTKTNTRVVLASVNLALGQHGDTTMLPILEAMAKAIKKNAKSN